MSLPAYEQTEQIPDGAGRLSNRSNVILLFMAVAAAFLVLEAGIRTYAWAIGRGFWESEHAFISPFFTTDEVPAPYADGDMRVFKEGERVPVVKGREEIRIVCLGGSTTLPALDASGYSYPHALRDRLARRFPDRTIVVLNAGGNGFSSAHTLVNLSLRVLEVQPDVVTIYHNINDLSVNYYGAGATSDYGNKYLTRYFLGFRHRDGFWGALERASRLVRIATNRIDLLRLDAPDFDMNDGFQTGAQFFRRNLQSIIGVARANGVEVAIGTQAARSKLRETNGFRAYNEVIREVAGRTHASLADVVTQVTDDADFTDDVHYTSDGAHRVAEVWEAPVAALVEKRIGARASTAGTGS